MNISLQCDIDLIIIIFKPIVKVSYFIENLIDFSKLLTRHL